MSSRPLLISVRSCRATGPIFQVRCAAPAPHAPRGVRSAPGTVSAPDPGLERPERDRSDHASYLPWAIASAPDHSRDLTKGSIVLDQRAAHDRGFLIRSARRAPQLRAASVEDKPTPPVMPLRTTGVSQGSCAARLSRHTRPQRKHSHPNTSGTCRHRLDSMHIAHVRATPTYAGSGPRSAQPTR